MKDVHIHRRGTEAQRIRGEIRFPSFSLCRLCVSVPLWLIFLFALLAVPAIAKDAAPLAQDEATEIRLVAISSELRCLVCQNESLSGSQAELAYDLRREIRTMIKDGKSDGEILGFMVDRYGDFVRYRPPLKGTTLLLWFGPALFFVVGLSVLVAYLRRRNNAIKDTPLSTKEQQQVDRLLNVKEPRQ